MARVAQLQRRTAEQDAFTLVELLIASVLALVAIGTVVTMFVSSNATQAGLQNRDAEVQQARTATEGIVREVRQASVVSSATPSSLTMVTYVDHATCGGAPGTTAIPCQVTYSCTGAAPNATCSRTERNKDGTGTGSTMQVVSGLNSTSVFCYAPSTNTDTTSCGTAAPGVPTTYVGVSLSFAPSQRQAPVTVADGAALLNVPPS
jgi:Tfp pilus assembly protein PilW